jgi:UDP-hydrolysing UDP-N-acetyl-D-glucosamine 2-epimerase
MPANYCGSAILSDARVAAVLTSGRQDYGILRSTLLLLRDDPGFDLRLIAGGMHLSAVYGMTVHNIEADGFRCAELLDWLGSEHEQSPGGEASAALRMIAEALARIAPDLLVLVGDRSETACAALAATFCRVPIVHLHGGEETEGAFDNAFRHAITKMSHLHLVSHAEYGDRVVQMGEDPASVHVVGAPGLDNLFRSDLPGRAELEALVGRPLPPPVVIVNLHPTTLADSSGDELTAVIGAMRRVPGSYLVTLPNCDPGNQSIRSRWREFAQDFQSVAVVEALGDRFYPAAMRLADAMIGNSSSALIEAPAISLPAVNVGDRQKGRRVASNVISVPPRADTVEEALRRALTPEFRRQVTNAVPELADGHVAQRIVSCLRSWRIPRPPRKRFFAQALRCAQN